MVSKVETILDRATSAAKVVKAKKHSDKALYEILTDCMLAVEACQRDGLAEINQRFKNLPLLPGRARQYVEKDSDLNQRVCRVVFHGVEHPNNINRYAIALREAFNAGRDSQNLMAGLLDGGINKFWRMRPKTAPMVRTRQLYLQRQIEHRRGAEFTVTLKLLKDGSYRVTNLDGCRYGVV